jgi:prepilin-type N-terminal cleavage/methylation domain-containing protein
MSPGQILRITVYPSQRLERLKDNLMDKRGVTLIELLIALVISAILVAGIYRVFISTQRSYTVQDQVVELQQNVRAAINKMMREIRMVNFGRIVSFDTLSGTFVSDLLPINIPGPPPRVFSDVLTTNPDDITIIGGFEQIRTSAGVPITVVSFDPGVPSITLSNATNEFDGANSRLLSIGGEQSFIVQNRAGATLTLDRVPVNPIGHFVFKIHAVRYYVDENRILRRDEFTGSRNQPMADNIESLQFQYLTANGTQTLIPNSTASVQVTITARTRDPDPTYTSEGGFRRRQIVSTIQLRNMGRGMQGP